MAENGILSRYGNKLGLSISRTCAVASTALKEAMRKRVLNVLLIFAVVIICSSVFFLHFAPGEEMKIVKDMGLGAIMFFGMLMAVFGTSGLIPAEVERRSIYTVLSKPVKRFEFILGKLFGILTTLLIMVFVMGAAFMVLVYVKGHTWNIHLIKAIILVCFELLILSSIAICISTRASAIFNAILTIFVFIVGHLGGSLIKPLGEHSENFALKLGIGAIYAIIPHFENFDLRNTLVLDVPVSNLLVLQIAGYSVIYSAVLLGFAYYLFNRREF